MTIYHVHHIIPRHMGGTNDPENLVRLTIEEHAFAHKKLYEEHGRWEDKLAWKALSGQISISEASKEAWITGSYKGGFAKKPNSVPAYNRAYFHCVGCRKEEKPYNILNEHKLCFQKFCNLAPTHNSGHFTSANGIKMANLNNGISTCPHCNKTGQYRAMKRWHFDRCPAAYIITN